MSEPAKFQIFKREDQYVFGEEGVMTTDPTPVQKAGLEAMLDAGVIDGSVYTMVANLPGFTLMHAWFKKDYPLPLHSHSANCLYYVIAGSARLGTEELRAGDSFFVPANTSPLAKAPVGSQWSVTLEPQPQSLPLSSNTDANPPPDPDSLPELLNALSQQSRHYFFRMFFMQYLVAAMNYANTTIPFNPFPEFFSY